ncbi:MAG: acyclic terpene utilization AtuA family protein [Pseudoclavibacter sp.]
MNTCKVFVPFPAIGFGITQESFDNGIKMQPDIISSDAGSTDSGPHYLGRGVGKYARESVKDDVRLILKGAYKLSIPVTIGSCGTCGNDAGVDEMEAICAEICAEENLSFKVAKIYTQQDPETLKTKYRAGKIHPLDGAPDISEATFDECTNIVALSGIEPFQEALRSGANLVLCGRATDTAIIAALPIMKGCNVASAWHGAKTAECGPLCTTNPGDGGVVLEFDEEGFTIEPTAAGSRCTVYTVSAHMLYENANPFRLTEPGGIIDVEHAHYTQVDDRRVRVTGTTITPAPQYTMKLEGAAPAGYQTITVVGIRARKVMNDPMRWIDDLGAATEQRLAEIGISRSEYSYALKPYGWNAVSGEDIEPGTYVPREIGLILVATAKTQELATHVAKTFNPKLLHFRTAENEQMPSFAFPFSPAEIEKGQIYEFRLDHVVDVDDPLELVRIVYGKLGEE